jgi:hypothetical protein
VNDHTKALTDVEMRLDQEENARKNGETEALERIAELERALQELIRRVATEGLRLQSLGAAAVVVGMS